jgi:glycosyltransferase involved in cell wall biosynthesis
VLSDLLERQSGPPAIGDSKPDPPLVSVIIPTLNSERALARVLHGVSCQTYARVETLVVDGGSRDSTVRVAQEFGSKVIPGSLGRSAARVHGASHATGKYLLFLDSDQIPAPELVAKCVSLCLSVGARAVMIPEVSIGSGPWVRFHDEEKRSLTGTWGLAYPRFFDRSSYFEFGGHPTEFEDYMEDRAVYLLARERNVSMTWVQSEIVNDLGEFDLIWYGRKNAAAAHDARAYYRALQTESVLRLALMRIKSLRPIVVSHTMQPRWLAGFLIYMLVGYGPRLLEAMTVGPERRNAGGKMVHSA